MERIMTLREVFMTGRCMAVVGALAVVAAVVTVSVAPVAGQAKSAIPRDAQGRPDLQGIWSYATVTPL